MSSTPSLRSTQNLINRNLTGSASRTLKIGSAEILDSDEDDDNNDQTPDSRDSSSILSSEQSPSIHRRTSAPTSTCRRRGSSLITSTDVDVLGIASASTGDIHSTSDVDHNGSDCDLRTKLLVKAKPPLPHHQVNAIKRKSIFRRSSRTGSCSAPR